MSKQKQRGTAARKSRQPGAGGDAPPPAADLSGVLERARAFHRSGRLGEALDIYRRVLEAWPDHAEALKLAGVASFQAGDTEHGVALLGKLVTIRPEDAEAHNNLGVMLQASGRPDEAEAAFRRALAVAPGFAGAHYGLGSVLESRGRLDDAIAAYRRAVEIEPDDADMHYNLGTALQGMGRLDEAVAAYERSIVLQPRKAEAHSNLGTALKALGRLDDAVAAYNRALRLKPDFAPVHVNLGSALKALGRLDDAVAAYRRAVALAPGDAQVHTNLADTLLQQGDAPAAMAVCDAYLSGHPESTHVLAFKADALLRQGDPEAAVAVCDAYLRDHPGDTRVLAFKAVALVETGEREAARALIDFDRFIRPTRVQAPDGFETVAAFNWALAQHVRAHPTLVYAPPTHATRQGRHTGKLLYSPTGEPEIEAEGPVVLFEGLIRDAVEDYRRALPADGSHPFLARPPERFGLSVWGVVLEGPGHQIPHIHPAAWLSGVYYAQLPDVVGESGPRGAGWIEFGRPPEHFHCTVEPEVRLVRPEEGLMVLFPSYFYHRTVPTESTDMRISIAFDVLAHE
ncbi:MAG: tetratricopeptide repeat protein [Proteobacteria bacterium]|nr:tetratricopeptide repeat protein [Pseudomonadota bacterium]